jgi:hypothetical protein
MSEFNELLYQTIISDSEISALTGATGKDPRIYKQKTPAGIQVSQTKPAYMIYYRSGTTYLSPAQKINPIEKNPPSYTIELWGIKDTTVEDLASLLEDLFNEKYFTTESYVIEYVEAWIGSPSWDDARQLYTGTAMVHFKKVLLNQAS